MAKNKITSLVNDMIDRTAPLEENIDYVEDTIADSSEFLNDKLRTHTKVKTTLIGNLVELSKNASKVILQTTQEMSVDDFGLVHNGFIFGSAEYAAVAAINEPNVVVIGCRSKFFAPARIGDLVSFEAKGRFEDARKREVKVVGAINDIKVFEGIFQAILLEKHILETKIEDLQSTINAKD